MNENLSPGQGSLNSRLVQNNEEENVSRCRRALFAETKNSKQTRSSSIDRDPNSNSSINQTVLVSTIEELKIYLAGDGDFKVIVSEELSTSKEYLKLMEEIKEDGRFMISDNSLGSFKGNVHQNDGSDINRIDFNEQQPVLDQRHVISCSTNMADNRSEAGETKVIRWLTDVQNHLEDPDIDVDVRNVESITTDEFYHRQDDNIKTGQSVTNSKFGLSYKSVDFEDNSSSNERSDTGAKDGILTTVCQGDNDMTFSDVEQHLESRITEESIEVDDQLPVSDSYQQEDVGLFISDNQLLEVKIVEDFCPEVQHNASNHNQSEKSESATADSTSIIVSSGLEEKDDTDNAVVDTSHGRTPHENYESIGNVEHSIHPDPVEFHNGCPKYVVFVGDPKSWVTEELRTFFFLPSEGSATLLCIRVSVNVPLAVIFKEILRRWRSHQCFNNPILSFKGQPVDLSRSILEYSTRDTFIVCNDQVDETLKAHPGTLWSCEDCEEGYHIKQSFEKHAKGHKPLFEDKMPTTTAGRIYDRYKTPWGAPRSSRGVKSNLGTSKVSAKYCSSTDVCHSSVLPQEVEMSEVQGSSTLSDKSTHCTDSFDKSRKSKRLLSKPLVSYAESNEGLPNDLTDDSEGEEFDCNEHECEYDDLESDFEVEKEDWRQKPRYKPPESDREDEDDEILEALRLAGKKKLEEKMKAELDSSGLQNLWVPDEQDIKDLDYFLVRPLIRSCKKYTHKKSLIPLSVRKKIENPNEPVQLLPSERKFVSDTPFAYEGVMKRLLYVWQEKLRENDPSLLSDDGMLHIRQFYAFREHNFIEPHDIREFFDSFSSPSVQSKIVEAYDSFLDQLFIFANSTNGKALFAKPMEDEQLMSQKELRNRGKMELNLLLQEITNTQNLIKSNKPYIKWKGDRLDKRNKRMKARHEFEGMPTNPDPKVIIDKWMKHESTREMNRRIVEAAENKEVVSPSELLTMTNHLIVMFSTKIGSRLEAFKMATWKDYIKAKKKGPSANPYSQLDMRTIVKDRPSVQANIQEDDEGDELYVRDPWSHDINDPEDVMLDKNVWEVSQGVCLELDLHKNGHVYKLYLWLNRFEEAYLLCYEEISANYFKFHLKKERGLDDPIFINTKGESFVASQKRVDLVNFCIATELPTATHYIFRKFYTNKVYSSKKGSFLYT